VSNEALRIAIDTASPTIGSIARAAGLRRGTLYNYLLEQRDAPPAVRIVVADILREQSERLLIVADRLSPSPAPGK
jgi:hypothetical protein